jgi:hypothetical protein
MTNLVTGVIGILLVLIFAGIMLWWVKALPIIVIFSIVILLLVYDFVQSLRANGNSRR